MLWSKVVTGGRYTMWYALQNMYVCSCLLEQRLEGIDPSLPLIVSPKRERPEPNLSIGSLSLPDHVFVHVSSSYFLPL